MNESEQAKLARGLKELEDMMRAPSYKDRIKLLAQDAWFQFNAYKEAGFTEKQAFLFTIREWRE